LEINNEGDGRAVRSRAERAVRSRAERESREGSEEQSREGSEEMKGKRRVVFLSHLVI
jgi:hypothetical protein